MVSPDNVEHSLQQLSLSDAGTPAGSNNGGSCSDGEDSKILKWNLPLKELYKMACSFYKEKSGKAIHLSYEDNLKLVAFTQQAIHGPLDLSKAPPLGMFDVIGKDRRIAWQHLGTITKLQAMEGFIDLLDRLCPLFKPYVEAIKKDREEKARQALAEEARRKEQLEREKEKLAELKRIEDEKNREEIQRRQLQDALNQQTYHQFKEYAEKQFPGNPEQQAVLIRQLQNEHYHQYMQQLQAQMAASNYSQALRSTSVESEVGPDGPQEQQHVVGLDQVTSVKEDNQLEYKEQCDSDDESGEYAVISPASMWTKPDIKLFKQEVTSGKGDGVIRVGHGDTVTVRVPTHEGGSCLFWEFATDNYDIGFGVYFEWGKPPTTEVSVHVSESDEDDDTLEDDDVCADDLECGGQQQHKSQQQQYNGGGGSSSSSQLANRNPISIIVPIYRRECQTEVYAGSHNYPGEGTYLLKFDNSYSLWRSKTLYYKVFYTR